MFDFAKSIYSLVDPVILAFREVSQMNRISGPKGDSFSTHCLRIGRGIHRPSCISELEQLASRGSPGKYHNPTKEDRFTSEHYPGYHQLLGICEEISIKSTRGSAHEPLLEMVEQLTTEYLQAKQVQDKIKELARILVETRRSRLRERNWPNTNTKVSLNHPQARGT